VNSPVRSFASVDTTPFIVERGQGPWIFDIDGNRYVDYVMSWGPLILGHAHPTIVDAVRKKVGGGTSFGAPTRGELELAHIVRERMPWVEKLRLVSSGTEACMTAARIARGATGRDMIVKFDGGYHGHSDGFLVKAGSGLATGNIPASAGVPENITRITLSLPYNDRKEVMSTFEKSGSRIAAVFVEPVAANMGVVPPMEGFLETLRDLTSRHGALLIFDEVITGFRLAPGGAAELFGVRPDLVCLGKILGGGLPIGAVGGSAGLMDLLAPLGTVYQAGTLSGNPLSTAAGIATLKELEKHEVYDSIRQYAEDLTGGIALLFERYGRSFRLNRVESLFTLFFSEEEVTDFDSAGRVDMTMYSELFRSLLRNGLFLPPSGFEAWFLSTVHGKEQLDLTLRSIEDFLRESER
jgi:glutamate-1-semialdehyde 2,1-aminomutase